MRSAAPAAKIGDLAPLPAQPDGVPWPTDEWPTREPGDACKAKKLNKHFDAAFAASPPATLGLTRALLVVHRGAIVAERYGPGFHTAFDEAEGRSPVPDGPDTRLTSWSMAKSMLQVAIGIAMRTHDLRVDRRVPVPEWDEHDDPRHQITWHHLLHMTSGLSWIEEYATDRGSDVINMLFGAGKEDVAAFAAAFPLSSRPGSQFLYSSGTSNILARALQHTLGLEGDEAGMRAWLHNELFDPIGMHDTEPHFDDAGTWVASSYVDATRATSPASGCSPCAVGPGTAAPSSNGPGSTRRATRSPSPPTTRPATARTGGPTTTAWGPSPPTATRVSASPASRRAT